MFSESDPAPVRARHPQVSAQNPVAPDAALRRSIPSAHAAEQKFQASWTCSARHPQLWPNTIMALSNHGFFNSHTLPIAAGALFSGLDGGSGCCDFLRQDICGHVRRRNRQFAAPQTHFDNLCIFEILMRFDDTLAKGLQVQVFAS